MNHLTRDPIDVGRLLETVTDDGRGGTVVFLGSVRRGAEDGPVAAIDYDAYEEMAGAEFERIIAAALQRWPEAGFAAQHRLGEVPRGQPSVAVVAAAGHRAEAFEACRFILEKIKLKVPIWKRGFKVREAA